MSSIPDPNRSIESDPLPGSAMPARLRTAGSGSPAAPAPVPSGHPGSAPAQHRLHAVGIAASSVRPTEDPLLVRVVRKRWLLLAGCVIAAASIAAAFAYQFGREEWSVSGKLLYTRLPSLPQTNYSGPDVFTAAELLKSNDNLARLQSEFSLDTSAEALYDSIHVEVPRGTQIVSVTATGASAQQAADILNRLLEMFTDQIAEVRRQKIQEYLLDVEANLQRRQSDVASASESLRAFQQQHGVWNVERDVERLSTNVEDVEAALVTAQQTGASLTTQLASVRASQQAMLLDLQRKMLDGLRARYDAVLALHAPQSRARAPIERLGAQMDAMRQELTGDPEQVRGLDEWMDEIARIDEELSSKKEGERAAVSPTEAPSVKRIEQKITQTQSHEIDLEISLVPKQAEIDLLTNRLKETTAELDRVRALRDESEELAEALREADLARQRVADHYNALMQLRDSNAREFTIVGAVTPGQAGIATTGKKLFAAAFLVSMLGLSLPVFGYEYFAQRGDPADVAARRFGLPVLARRHTASWLAMRGRGRDEQDDNEYFRLVALRIQQSVTAPGSVILFSSLGSGTSTVPLVCRLAQCLAERDERVLVIDAGKTATPQDLAGLLPWANGASRLPANAPSIAAEPPAISRHLPAPTGERHFGLSDYLSFDSVTLSDLVNPTRIAGVDCVVNGKLPFPREGFATHRMTELLQRCRERYNLILVSGPSADQAIDLEVLAARADGIVFNAAEGRGSFEQQQDALRNLIELEAPIMGVVG